MVKNELLDTLSLCSKDFPLIDQLIVLSLFIYALFAGLGSLVKIAPYGKYSYSNSEQKEYDFMDRFNFIIPGKIGWCIQESPALLTFALTFYRAWVSGTYQFNVAHGLHFALFQLHYMHRAFIYTWVRCVSMSDTNIVCVGMAFVFCVLNGYINAKYSLMTAQMERPLLTAVGVILFLYGFYINYTSDGILFQLRREGAKHDKKDKYQIPRGGYFEYVTCANYFGEVVEWIGWALVTRHAAAIVFAFFTICFLSVRAHSQHKWYQNKFGSSYPATRKSIFPFLL